MPAILGRCKEVDLSKEAYQEAVAAALKSACSSYSPYTRCPAAVALFSHKGIHLGGIVENAAHNPTLQPLQAALINARIDGLTDYSDVRIPSVIFIWIEAQNMPQACTL